MFINTYNQILCHNKWSQQLLLELCNVTIAVHFIRTCSKPAPVTLDK